MEQQQFRVSFSVGTKLLVSVVLLLSILIIFLNLSSIWLFREDKRAYIYETQSTTSVLAGKEFVMLAEHALGVLRQVLAGVDPSGTLDSRQQSAIQYVINNQTEVISGTVFKVDPKTGVFKAVTTVSNEQISKRFDVNPKDYVISEDWMKHVLPALMSKGYAFLNLSKLGQTPTLIALYADRSEVKTLGFLPVIAGIVSLKSFGDELSKIKLTIATRSGWSIYDTDSAAFYKRANISGDPLFKAALASKLASGAQEYDTEGEHFIGSYVMPGLDLVVITKTEWQKAMRATYSLIEKFILLGAIAVGAGVIFAIVFSKTLTGPLERLYDATKQVAQGNFLLRLQEAGRDEIAALSHSFNTMSQKIGELIQESIAKAHLENELAIASTVQQTLIPPQEFKTPWLEIQSQYLPAEQCGGDWWGFFGVRNKIAIMIADATGHGLPSALITASARSCFSVMHKLAQEDEDFSFSPSAMLSYANRVVYDASGGKIMMTFFIASIDSETGELTYSSAGHNPPWLYKKEGDGFSLRSLTAVGQRLGEAREAPPFEEKSLQLGADDVLVLYTDGLIEGKNVVGEMHGKKNARKSIEAALTEGPRAVINKMMEDFLKHNGDKALDDDVTLAAVKFLGPTGTIQTNVPV